MQIIRIKGYIPYLPGPEPIEFFDTFVMPGYNPRLMSGPKERLPVEVDPFRMAEQGRRFQGSIELKQMKRLVPLLESTSGCLNVELLFGIDGQGIRNLKGRLKSIVPLTCQRCMSEMHYSLDIEFRLALLSKETEIEKLGEEYEPLIVAATPVRLSDIIEDEVLLAIPQIPMHELNDCPARIYGETDDETKNEAGQNPFAVLADLKKDN